MLSVFLFSVRCSHESHQMIPIQQLTQTTWDVKKIFQTAESFWFFFVCSPKQSPSLWKAYLCIAGHREHLIQQTRIEEAHVNLCLTCKESLCLWMVVKLERVFPQEANASRYQQLEMEKLSKGTRLEGVVQEE